MTRMAGPDCVVICNFIITYTHKQVSLIPPWEDQCERHRMTRMTGPDCAVMLLLLLLLFLTFSALVANPKKLLYTVANPARGLLNRENKKKKKSGSPPPPPRARCSFGENK